MRVHLALFAAGSLICSCGLPEVEPSATSSADDELKKKVDAGKASPDSGIAHPDAGIASLDAGAVPSDAGAVTAPTLITEPDQGLTPIYNLISSAKKTLDMTMYELKDTTITSLLTTAVKNGVTVRVMLDQNGEKNNNTTAYNALNSGKVLVHWANPTYSLTHQKTITIDGTTSAIMTMNLTPEGYSTNRDFVLVTNDAADVAAIEATFNADFSNSAITPPTGDNLVWSPTNSQTSLVSLIGGAKTSLLIENEEMDDSAIVSALTSAAGRGVSVKVVMTDSSSWHSNFATLVKAGVKVVTYASTAAIYIHAKVILADYGTSNASVFLGSENFSSTSLGQNRELGIISTDSAAMASIEATLTKDFAGGTTYP